MRVALHAQRARPARGRHRPRRRLRPDRRHHGAARAGGAGAGERPRHQQVPRRPVPARLGTGLPPRAHRRARRRRHSPLRRHPHPRGGLPRPRPQGPRQPATRWWTSPSCDCPTSPTSTTSTRSTTSPPSPCATWDAPRTSATPTSSSSPAARPPSPTSTGCAPPDSLSACWPTATRAVRSSAYAPATRCSATTLLDPDGVESPRPRADGLGLLPATTTFTAGKATHQVVGRVVESPRPPVRLRRTRTSPPTRYTWVSRPTRACRAPSAVESRSGRRVALPDGAMDADGLTLGTYLHGLFHNRAVRRSILECAARRKRRRAAAARGRRRAQRRVRQACRPRPPPPRHGPRLPRHRPRPLTAESLRLQLPCHSERTSSCHSERTSSCHSELSRGI